MRLSKIRIAGFKSFVDPTTLEFRGNLSGVVGPNGCGKSNIIDAMQWVLGESSAKHLRGDSMADVIFNGSGTRKPVGQASVEIVFDNSDGKIGGQYASYNEISIKRHVGRDGLSAYFLNGVRCRRRDITGIFLGTGIGARAYSVIEQGMISRVVEARPEDMRSFFEEAAGISRYKERRRETENRIRNARENLSRVTDIVTELDKQLQHLHRQARSAERYQQLKADERTTQAELHALRWRALKAQLDAHQHEAELRANALEAANAALRRAESEIVKQRDAQVAATDGFNAVQAGFYAVSAEVARLEQQIQHAQERQRGMERDLEEAEHARTESAEHIAGDEQRLGSLDEELDGLEPQQARQQESEAQSQAELTAAEQHLSEWQARWDECQRNIADAEREQHVEQTRLEHLEDVIDDARHRIDVLRRERDGLGPDALQAALIEVGRRLSAHQSDHERLHAEHQDAHGAMQRRRQEMNELSARLDELRREQQQLVGRHASLEALQQSSLGTDRPGLADWLERLGLQRTPRAADLIEVDGGWEWAVEMAARLPLQALCVDGVDAVAARVGELQEGRVAALTSVATTPVVRAKQTVGIPLLAEKFRASPAIAALFAGVYAADSLDEARAAAQRLSDGESVITRDGTWMGPGWLSADRETAAADSLLQRTQELRTLEASGRELAHAIGECAASFEASRTELESLEQRDTALRAEVAAGQESLATLRSQIAAGETRLEQTSDRLARLEGDLQELEAQRAEDTAELQAVSERLQRLRARRDALDSDRQALAGERDEMRRSLADARSRWQAVRDAGYAHAARIAALRSERAAREQSLARNRGLVDRVQGRSGELLQALQAFAAPFAALQSGREAALAERLQAETQLTRARSSLQEAETRMRELEQQRLSVERDLEQRRTELEQARMEARSVEIRAENVVEQLGASGSVLDEVLAVLPAEAAEAQWEDQLAELGRRIQRLGPINLAAIDEFSTLAERKTYLDSQHADLSEALATLEEAMRKIDRETRTRFRETFDKVNSGFQTLFPALFGGGHAYLELTGEDLLETGVTVIARPPGKRNSTIHLLSGGEKALTAVALVFAIFELNPAPFCLLDEVDAPLDDANVVRFTEMLQQRARGIQFIFITHNKITMEIADQLVGVTMQEAGVSRLVSVNMDEAVRLAATA